MPLQRCAGWRLAVRVAMAAMVALVATLMPCTAGAMAVVTDVRELALSERFGCAISATGALRCAGENAHGELGQGSADGFVPFARETLPSGVSAVALGSEHACAIRDGGLWCWGGNSHGQVGGGLVGARVGTDVKRPLQIIASGVTAIAAGGQSTCAVVSGGLQCWGRNDDGQVGNGIPANAVGSPLDILPSGVTAVATGGQHSCAVVRGDLQCWGFLLSGEGSRFERQLMPRTVISGGVTAVAASLHTCAIVRGALLCWGRNFNGQVGVPGGAANAPGQPTPVIATGVTSVALNDRNTCALADGALLCWGDNFGRQLGTTAAQQPQPLRLVERGVTAVGMGMNTVCAVISGHLECTNRAPQADTPPQDWLALGTQPTLFSVPDPVPPRLPTYGVWRGTLGQQEVMVNLKPEGCDPSYYYLRHLSAIPLTEKGKVSAQWQEGAEAASAATALSATSATWTIDSATASAIEGTWSDAQGLRRLPIRLKKLSDGVGLSADCSSKAAQLAEARFLAPLIVARSPKTQPSPLKAYPHEVLSVPGTDIQTVQVPATVQAVPRLNQHLRDWLKSQVAAHYDCQLNLRRFNANEVQAIDYASGHEPVFWNAHVLVLRESYSNYCGGAHPNGGVADFISWDLDKDKALETGRWIRLQKTKASEASLPPKLQALLIHHYKLNRPGDDECADAVQFNSSYLMHPQADGMVFTPSLPHVVQACADDVQVAWPELLPFLTPAGRADVKDKIQSAKPR